MVTRVLVIGCLLLAAGVVPLEGRSADVIALESCASALPTMRGVREVILRKQESGAAGTPGGARRWQAWRRWVQPSPGRRWIRFPTGDVFAPPLADQKQPRFHTSYQRYNLDFGNFNVASVGFGENFGLARRPGESIGSGMQVGISGAVFAIFNLDADSNDLLNADYYIGFPLSWRRGRASGRIRLFHLSSHLGYEFLLSPQPGPPVERINLSYEAMEVLGSLEWRSFRIYGGAIRILHSVTPLERNRLQAGAEFRGRSLAKLGARPVVALDLQAWNETDWDLDLSIKGGLRFPSPYGGARSVQLFLEYFDGHVPHGHFYRLEAGYVGLGLAFSL
ncbi:MAG: DUF1207 domain-containing protein [Gemmatimonadota bacterium]|nr:DUF1207 domain-containing protein [Gemmatimonadota bacterium]